MLVPVACGQCGKPFQVPKGEVGRPAVCPWCRANVSALPVALPETAGSLPEVLSLDEGPPPAEVTASSSLNQKRRSPVGWLVRGVMVLAVMAAVFALTFTAVRYGSGWVPSYGWVEFVAPDGSCRVEMPTSVSADELYPAIPDFPMTRPGRKYIARTWYSGVTTSAGWVEVDPERAKTLRLEDLAGGEAARRKGELGAMSTAMSTVKRGEREGIEVVYRTPDGVVIDRMVYIGEGANPRLYVLSYSAQSAGRDSPAVVRFFHSFRPGKK